MTGEIPKNILKSFTETIPIEFTVIDEKDKVLAWNKDETRVFKRAPNIIGRDVHDCHPKESIAKVEQILKEMKEGKREKAEFWIDLKGGKRKRKNKILIQYFALRDEKGKYIGCLEATQDISHIQKINGEKRLLD